MQIKLRIAPEQYGLYHVVVTHDDGFEYRMSFNNEWGLDDEQMLKFCEEQSLIVKDLWQSKGKWTAPPTQGGSIVETHQEARAPSPQIGEDKE